eukprot:5637504-Karenia_brevis.AAC.1
MASTTSSPTTRTGTPMQLKVLSITIVGTSSSQHWMPRFLRTLIVQHPWYGLEAIASLVDSTASTK